MTCTCSGHANEPDPCPECLTKEDRFDEIVCAFDDGDLDAELGAFVREREKKHRTLIDKFLETRLEAAIP